LTVCAAAVLAKPKHASPHVAAMATTRAKRERPKVPDGMIIPAFPFRLCFAEKRT
jgi:hypothetical protein